MCDRVKHFGRHCESWLLPLLAEWLDQLDFLPGLGPAVAEVPDGPPYGIVAVARQGYLAGPVRKEEAQTLCRWTASALCEPLAPALEIHALVLLRSIGVILQLDAKHVLVEPVFPVDGLRSPADRLETLDAFADLLRASQHLRHPAIGTGYIHPEQVQLRILGLELELCRLCSVHLPAEVPLESSNHLQQRVLACATPVCIVAQSHHRSLLVLVVVRVLLLVLGLGVLNGLLDLLVGLTVGLELLLVQLLVDGPELSRSADRPASALLSPLEDSLCPGSVHPTSCLANTSILLLRTCPIRHPYLVGPCFNNYN